MYQFIFHIYYSAFRKLNAMNPRDNAIGFVALTIFFQGFLALSLLDYFDSNLLRKIPYHLHLITLLFFLISTIHFTWKYFNLDRIKENNPNSSSVKAELNLMELAFALLLTFIPLLLGIYFLNHKNN